MADIAKRLVGPIAVPNANTVVYTVPANTTTIIRNIHIVSATSSVLGFSLAISASTAVIGSCFFYQIGVPSNGAVDWSGFLVLNANDTIQVLASITSNSLTISGIEVS